MDDRIFEEIEFDCTNISSREELIEKLIDLKLEKNNMYKIILNGNRNFEIDSRKLLQAVNQDNILKMKDQTRISYDIEEIVKQNNLKGIFVKELLKMYQEGGCTEEELQKAIEIGLDAMK